MKTELIKQQIENWKQLDRFEHDPIFCDVVMTFEKFTSDLEMWKKQAITCFEVGKDYVSDISALKRKVMELEEGLCSCRDGLIWRKENYPNGWDESDADQLEYVNQLINP